MKNIPTYIKNTNIILLALLLVVLLNTCGTKASIKSLKKEITRVEMKNDSLNREITKSIEIEGLKSEKRMIQSTDRKMMDVNRMSEIDKEIKVISNGK